MSTANHNKAGALPSGNDQSPMLQQTLNEIAAVLHQSARSEKQVLRAFEEQLNSAGLLGFISDLTSNADTLNIRAISLLVNDRMILQEPPIEIPVPDADIYWKLSQKDETIYFFRNQALISQVITSCCPQLPPEALETFSRQPVILAALRSGENIRGTLTLSAPHLTIGDIPAVNTFARHISISLETADAFSEFEKQRLANQRQEEYALTENEQKLRSFVQQSADGIVLIDEAGEIIEWNHSLQQITGLEREHVLGHLIWDVQFTLSKDQKNKRPLFHRVRSEITEFLHTGEAPWTNLLIEHEILNGRNEQRVLQVINFPIPTEKGYMAGSILRDVTEQKQLEVSLRQKADELAALHSVSLKITAAQNLPDLLQTIVEKAVQLIDGSGGILNLCDAEKQELYLEVSYRSNMQEIGSVIKYGEGAAGMIAVTAQPLLIEDYCTWPKRAALTGEKPDFHAVIGAPMIWQGQVSGVVIVFHKDEKRSFTPTDLEILTLFANQAAIAIENARLFEAEGQRAAELEAVRQASLSLTASLDLPQVLNAILRTTLNLLPESYDSHIFLYDPEEDQLTFGAALWASDSQDHPWNEPRPNGLTYTVAHSGEVIAIRNMREHPLLKKRLQVGRERSPAYP